MNQRELSQDRKYFTNLENQLSLVKDECYQMQIAHLMKPDHQFYLQENTC